MALIVSAEDATDLGLPGRVSREIVSGARGSRSVTLRRVEIPVERDGDPGRSHHSHPDCEECIHVLSGSGLFCTEDQKRPLRPGDTVLVPPGERHHTRNTGREPLELLCFFPVAELDTAERRDRDAEIGAPESGRRDRSAVIGVERSGRA